MAVNQQNMRVEDNELLKSLNKLSKEGKNPKAKHVHKYRRFSKKNKTYRTDVYFCANCGNRVSLENMFGLLTQCWKCGKNFTFNFVGRMPLFPMCSGCENRKNSKDGRNFFETNNSLNFLEDEKGENESKEDFIENTLKELGLK